MKILFKRLFSNEKPILKRLKFFPLFKNLSRNELREIEQIMPRKFYGPEESIFKQGEPGMSMFVVLSGRVDIVQEGEDGSQLKLVEIKDGSIFGEMALLDNSLRTASAVATEKTEIMIFSRKDLLTLAEQWPHLGVKILMHLSQIVAERLRRTNRALRGIKDEIEVTRGESELGGETEFEQSLRRRSSRKLQHGGDEVETI